MANPFSSYRKKYKLSQQGLADKLGISRQLVGLIESGKRRITPDNAVEWEQKLGVSREFLMPMFFAKPKPRVATSSAGTR